MRHDLLIKDILSRAELSRLEKILFIISLNSQKPKKIDEIKQIAIQFGLREINNWNISLILNRSKGRAVRTTNGWELTTSGMDCISKFIPLGGSASTLKIKSDLHNLVGSIKNKNTQHFVEEAISCYDNNLYRSAVVLSWVGAVSTIYDYIIANSLTQFNSAALKRNPKWKPAKNIDDLAKMRERDFLEILEDGSIIGKSVKNELITCLNFRNGCGHPNSLTIGESRVAAHIETLILNVFSKFS